MFQIGGGNCTLCGSPNTNKSTCPCNPAAVKPNYEKHPLSITCMDNKLTKQKSPPKPVVVQKSPPKPVVVQKSPPKPDIIPTKKQTNIAKKAKKPVLKKVTQYEAPEITDYDVEIFNPIEFQRIYTKAPVVKTPGKKIKHNKDIPKKIIDKEPTTDSEKFDFLMDILTGWQGLNSLITWKIGKKYLGDCDSTCELPEGIPENEEITNNFIISEMKKWDYDPFSDPAYDGRMIWDLEREKKEKMKQYLTTYKPNPKLKKTNKCDWIGYGPQYTPSDCINIFKPGAIVTNRINGKKYIMIEKSYCLLHCTHNSYIYQELGTNLYYIIFAVGSLHAGQTNMFMLSSIVSFVVDVLSKYLINNNKVVIAGHSAGFANALYLAKFLSMNLEEIEILQNYTQCSLGDYCTNQMKLKDIYNSQNSSEGNLNLLGGNEFRFGKDKYKQKLLNDFEKYKTYRTNHLNQIKNNLITVGSGGHPIIGKIENQERDIYSKLFNNFDSIQQFYKYNILHFGTFIYYSISSNWVIDAFLLADRGTRNNTDLIGLINYVDEKDDEWNDNYSTTIVSGTPINMQPDRSLHAFDIYRNYFAELFKKPKENFEKVAEYFYK